MACLTQLMSIVSAFYTNASISGKIRSISGTGNLWIWRSKKIHYSPIQSYASAVVPDSFTLPSQQSAILASLEKEYGVFHGLIPDLELRRSKIQNLYGFRVKVCTCQKAVLSTVERWNVYQMMLYWELPDYTYFLELIRDYQTKNFVANVA